MENIVDGSGVAQGTQEKHLLLPRTPTKISNCLKSLSNENPHY